MIAVETLTLVSSAIVVAHGRAHRIEFEDACEALELFRRDLMRRHDVRDVCARQEVEHTSQVVETAGVAHGPAGAALRIRAHRRNLDRAVM